MLALAPNKNRLVVGLMISALALSWFSGCKVGPDFQTPATSVQPQWNFASHPLLQGAPADIQHWWVHFHDPALHALIDQSLAQNLSLQEAAGRIMEARARRAVTAGLLFPQYQAAEGSFSQIQASQNVANFFSLPGIFVPDLHTSNFQAGLATSWELDFWGKYRRSIEAADGRLNATIAAYDEARVLILAELAKSYIQMRMAESRIQLAQKNLEIQQKTLKLAEEKLAAGLGTGLDTAQAKINVGTTTAVLPVLETTRLQASHRICTLLGRPPMDLACELGYTGQIPIPDRNLCFGIPADLVRRRPDVRNVEAQLAAQSAKIGIAKADFYPRISLTGRIGYSAEHFDQLFASKSAVGVISPGFAWNLLNYGRIKSNVEAEKAAFLALCNNYRNSVIKAAQEAEDAQVAYVLSHDRLRGLQQAVDGARDAVDKVEKLYEAGSIDFGRVYILQAGLLEKQDAMAQTEASIAVYLVDMFKTLGGGWEQGCEPAIVAGQPIVVEGEQFESASWKGQATSHNQSSPVTSHNSGAPQYLAQAAVQSSSTANSVFTNEALNRYQANRVALTANQTPVTSQQPTTGAPVNPQLAARSTMPNSTMPSSTMQSSVQGLSVARATQVVGASQSQMPVQFSSLQNRPVSVPSQTNQQIQSTHATPQVSSTGSAVPSPVNPALAGQRVGAVQGQ